MPLVEDARRRRDFATVIHVIHRPPFLFGTAEILTANLPSLIHSQEVPPSLTCRVLILMMKLFVHWIIAPPYCLTIFWNVDINIIPFLGDTLLVCMPLHCRPDGASSPISSRVPNDNADDEEEEDPTTAAAALKNAGTKIKRGPDGRRDAAAGRESGGVTTIPLPRSDRPRSRRHFTARGQIAPCNDRAPRR